MRSLLALLLCISTLGCTLRTDSKVTVANPVVANAKMEISAARAGAHGPVIEMPIGSVVSTSAPKIAVIDVDGLIVNQNLDGLLESGDNPVAIFQEKLAAAQHDSRVCAVVLRINSPGGGVTACDMMRQEVLRFRQATGKPVVACLLDVGAGGAYYLATAADRITAHPTTLTGGIGVIWNSYNLRDLMAQFNILPQSIKAGAQIDLGSSTRALTPEAKKILQDVADEFHERFKAAVLKSRPQIDAKLESNFDGQVFTAQNALKRGMIDQVGYFDDAVAAARQLAKHSNTQVVLYRRVNDPAYSALSVSCNLHANQSILPIHLPGLMRSRLPTFLYLWQPEPALDR